MGGGKSGSTTQSSTVSIPPEVLARYNAVNSRAEQTAGQNFQPFTGEFVAPLNPTQQGAISNISQAQGIGGPFYDAAAQSVVQGANQAMPYYGGATQALAGGAGEAMPFFNAAQDSLYGGAAAAAPQQMMASYGISDAQAGAQPYQQAATQSVLQARAGAQPYQMQATQSVGLAQAQARPLENLAARDVTQAQAAAAPMQGLAARGFAQALSGAQPYQAVATNLGLAGTAAVNPGGLNGDDIDRYMSPYTQRVADATLANLRQQQGQEQSDLIGRQIQSGAFGGDRGRIAQANLARQHDLATAQAMSGIYGQGYTQALNTAQQQQTEQLQAEQANRAALQAGAQQMAALGQQGFGQATTTAQQMSALGQQGFSQGLAAAQQRAALGQQAFNRNINSAQQLAALGQQGFGQDITAAQQFGNIGQQGFTQDMTAAQQRAALGQQMFNQGATGAQQLSVLGQNIYNVGAGVSQGLAGLGQGVYNIGAGAGQNLANIGTAAQTGALQGAQAQLAAGTVQQQTQQAQNQADYNQFLQQQGYPFQIAQFLANIAMGTGALSGSTTNATTTSPQSFFSDERLKQDVEPIGKTFDGQNIVRFKYKGEPGTRIGLIAQDVEKHHPRAVGLAAGYKTVDYDEATDDAARRGHFAYGGGLAAGGTPDISDALNQLLTAHQGMYPYGKSGLYGRTSERGGAYGTTLSPVAARGLMRAELAPPPRQESGLSGINNAINTGRNLGSAYTGVSRGLLGGEATDRNPEGTRGLIGRGGDFKPSEGWVAANLGRDSANPGRNPVNPPLEDTVQNNPPPDLGYERGGLVPGYALGGTPYGDGGADGYVPDDKADLKKLMEQFNSMGKGAGLAKPGDSGPGLLGGLAQIGGAASGLGSIASGIGSILPFLGLRDGGAVRPGYALDGSVEEPVEGGADAATQPVNDNLMRPRDAENGSLREAALRALDRRPKEEPKNWMQRNQDWFVPVLTGLGAMAASPSRYAGAAMLQGLGAGAGQYAAMQERGIEQQRQAEQTDVAKGQAYGNLMREANQERQLQEQVFQRTLQMFGERLPDGNYKNPFGPGVMTPLEMQKYAYQVAYGGNRPPPGQSAPVGGGAPPPGGLAPPAPQVAGQTPGVAVATPAQPAPQSPQAGQPPQQQRSQPQPQQALPQFQPEYDMSDLRRRAAIAEQSGQQAEATRLRDRATSIEQGVVIPFTMEGQPFYGFREKAELHKQANERIAKEGEAAARFREEYEPTRNIIASMSDIWQNVNLGRFSSVSSTISAIARQLGIQGGELNKIETAAASNDKQAIQQAFRTMSEYAQRAPAAGLREALMTVANSEQPPGAAYNILTRSMGQLDRQRDQYVAWVNAGQPDPLKFGMEWDTKVPLAPYVQKAVNATPYFQGMTEGDRRSLPVMREDDPLREERARQQSGAPPRARQADAGGRRIVVRNGQWVYADTGKPYIPNEPQASNPQGGGQ